MLHLTLPRRRFLQGACIAAGGNVAGMRPRLGLAVRPQSVSLYLLSTFYDDGGDLHCGGCRFCKACIRHAANKLDTLSDREAEVLRLVAAGLPNREIGQYLFISEKVREKAHREYSG